MTENAFMGASGSKAETDSDEGTDARAQDIVAWVNAACEEDLAALCELSEVRPTTRASSPYTHAAAVV